VATVREINEERESVKNVGDFTTSLQQIAAGRMIKLKQLVLAANRFADEATIILRELELEKTKQIKRELNIEKSQLSDSKKPKLKLQKDYKSAIIIITSDQGLCGSYNSEIFRKSEEIIPNYLSADYFVIGSKGQDYFKRISKKNNLKYFPYNVPNEIVIEDLKPLISMFYHYDQIFLIYNRYINTATRKAVFIELAIPNIELEELKKEKAEGKYIFEPNLGDLIDSVSAKLRYALFRQQILDSKLALYTAHMIAMQTASENAKELINELNLEYKKAKRKLVDKKIQEVQAGRILWDEED
jgi:F-type H+-transporting ATPase subunit gamma